MAGTTFLMTLVLASAPGMGVSTLDIACERPFEIGVTLTNTHEEPLTIGEGSLPWSTSSSTLDLRGYALAGMDVAEFDRVAPIADYFATVTIAPRASLRGTIDLAMTMPELVARADDADVAIRIAVRRLPVGEDATTWQEWMLFIPERGLLTSDCPTLIRLGETTRAHRRPAASRPANDGATSPTERD